MSRGLGFIFLFFFIIVGFNFAALSLQRLVGGHWSSGLAMMTQASDNGLTSIDFNLFAKNGTGLSFITQGYGHTPWSYLYINRWHDGIDIAAAYGAPVYAPTAGTVLAVGNQDDYCWHRGFGKYVAVQDNVYNVVQWYAHLGTVNVAVGQSVTKGILLGTVGATGYETGTHLHFSIFDASGFSMPARNGCGPDPTGQDRDPIPFLQGL